MERCEPRVQDGSHIYTLRVQKNMKDWTHTPPSGFPLWELEFLWSLEFSENDFKGQKSLDWELPYIEKLLRCKCLKWAHIIHLNTYNTSYGWKKGWESKCKFDSRPLKVGNCFDLCVCKWHATYSWLLLLLLVDNN
jgi:hypothetical protein